MVYVSDACGLMLVLPHREGTQWATFTVTSTRGHQHTGLDKMATILQRHFQMHFMQWNIVLFGSNGTEVCVCVELPTLFLIRPFEKRTYYAVAMSVRPSVRPSVCPSVRPSVRVFRTFLQHALRYQFETWYIHSVGGTTCRVWVASQLGHFDLVYSQK